MSVTILQKPVEEIDSIDQTFDLVYMDPPFGLQRDFTMQEEDGQQKGFSDKWESFDDYTDWYANVINSCWNLNLTRMDGCMPTITSWAMHL